jgi:hypothetical protein
MVNSEQIVSRICSANEWIVDDDLTETLSGSAEPVLRVTTDYGPAVLRTGVDARTLETYRMLGGSGVTPQVYADGVESGARWLLAEWIAGEPLLSLPPRPGAVDGVFAATVDVLRAARALYVHPAPPRAREAAVAHARRTEMDIVLTMKLAKSTPHLVSITQNHWEPAVWIHGDLLSSNVIRQADGNLRFIDPEGGFGPPEKDAGRWMAQLCGFILHRAESLDHALVLAKEQLDTTLAEAPWLDPTRLRAWTAVQLCSYAQVLRSSGAEAGRYRALVWIAGRIEPPNTAIRSSKIPRNASCPCGSGRKYKKCCGQPR